jgi:Cu+-exporting ATPase
MVFQKDNYPGSKTGNAYKKENETSCFHCGENIAASTNIRFDEKAFCCRGCKTVYQVLNQAGLCEYYNYAEKPGINQRIEVRENKFAFLEDKSFRDQLIQFADDEMVQVNFYLPQMHCSSCLWLLEHLQKINDGVYNSRVDFNKKEVTIQYNEVKISLKQLAELLTSIGYEPHISLQV